MKATAWKGGSATYGIRVGKPNRKKYFDKKWRSIDVEIDGRFRKFALTDGFWRDCPEFRDRGEPIIRKWLEENKVLDWPKGQPTVLELTPLGNGRFRLHV